jgi:hypothetical protein
MLTLTIIVVISCILLIYPLPLLMRILKNTLHRRRTRKKSESKILSREDLKKIRKQARPAEPKTRPVTYSDAYPYMTRAQRRAALRMLDKQKRKTGKPAFITREQFEAGNYPKNFFTDGK